MKLIFPIILFGLIASGCAQAKPVARTVNDVARLACEVTFGAEPLPAGMTLEDVCEAHENLQPFVDQILAAQAGVKAGLAK